jgi:hypothetical protein
MTSALGGTTRRQFLIRGGALAGALAIGGGTAALLPAGGRAEAATLSPERQRTYTALMEAVVTQPSVRLDPAVAPRAAADFAAAYAGWPAERRRDADAVLDALERAPAATGFSRLDRRGRGAELRDGSRASSPRPTGAEHARLELTARALELAAVVLGPPDSGHQIVTV